MSLAIITSTPEGIVFAADSRQSYRNRKGMARIGSDNVTKLFQINDRVGVAVTGAAFLFEGGVAKNISKFIEEFKQIGKVQDLDVATASNQLHSHMNTKWQNQITTIFENIKSNFRSRGCEVLDIKRENNVIKFRFTDPQKNVKDDVAYVDSITFLVAGYNEDGSHEGYICSVPGEKEKVRDSKQRGMEYGVNWIGQTDVVARIVLGYDMRIGNVKFFQDSLKQLGKDELKKQLGSLEYNIQYGTMTLQDAIDFCTLIIQTTSAIQRFSDGIIADPGDIPGVGGPIDIAVITPQKNFAWISKKKLKMGEDEIGQDRKHGGGEKQ